MHQPREIAIIKLVCYQSPHSIKLVSFASLMEVETGSNQERLRRISWSSMILLFLRFSSPE